jgi:NAD(P)H dehydrogenase (quinone)
MIVVTGATGHFGKATIDFLLKKGVLASNISALVRDISKADDLKAKGINIKIGNYDDYASILAAFKNAEKVLLVSGTDITNRQQQQENAVKAAKEAGVKHIVYTSFVRRNETETSPIAAVAKSHIETEKYIKASGIPYTIMLNSLYADVLPMFVGEKVLETGIFFPAGDGKTSFATRLDMAEAAASILAGEGHENKEYVVASSSKYSLNDVAAILSELSGKKITYTSPATEVYIETLSKAGVPIEYAGVFAGFGGAIKQGEFDTATSDLEKLIGRKPTALSDYLKSVYSYKPELVNS